ncbi:MAG: PfkB family carbohydrate kinase [Deltaproteobacteria bacterium]|nr:PfkB family carbohydrate kinase [Deltaproteobacteria bacterium]
MDIIAVGSVAFDSVETPFGKANEVLGGSVTYFSASASYFAKVGVVAVVGDDFKPEHEKVFKDRGVDTRGIRKVAGGKTFRWKGKYEYDLNVAHTLDTQLNVFSSFKPEIPKEYGDAEFLFLGNIDPVIQEEVLSKVKKPRLIACDTMNFWIEGKPHELRRLLSKVEMLVINEAEARELAKTPNLVKAAKAILALGPKTLIVKRGEYGALMFSSNGIFSAPAYPLEDIFDPTGAGDSFAGGLVGYLAKSKDLSEKGLRRAIVFGSAMASFNVEAFSLKRLASLTEDEINKRYGAFKALTHFEEL